MIGMPGGEISDEVIDALVSDGLLVRVENELRQAGGNCFEIAVALAKKFGYAPPKSEGEVMRLRDLDVSQQLWGKNHRERESDAYLVHRARDNQILGGETHITFEHRGVEYNFGPGDAEGFVVDRRIPLSRTMAPLKAYLLPS